MISQELIESRERAKRDKEPILRDKSLEILLKTVRDREPKNILEIGTNVGLSGVAMLLECEKSRLTGIEIDEEKAETARRNYERFGVSDRAKIFVGDASEILPVLTGKYDLIFLDGPKGHYYEYLSSIIPALNKNGVLFTDDILFHGYIKGNTPKKHNTIKHSIDSFLKEITENKDLKTEILEIEDGIAITEKLI